MRAFVGLEVAQSLRHRLEWAIEAIRPSLPAARWVPAENWHVTLAFLGRVDESQLAALDQEIEPIVSSVPVFELSLGEPGIFPRAKPGRIAWVGVNGCTVLDELQRRIAASCRRLDFEIDRRAFTPHLTVARCRKPWPRSACTAWEGVLASGTGLVLGSSTFGVRRACLFQTVPGSGGGVSYRVVRSYLLAGQEAVAAGFEAAEHSENAGGAA